MSYDLELPAVYVDAVETAGSAVRLILINVQPTPDDQDVPRSSEVLIGFGIYDTADSDPDQANTNVTINGEAAVVAGVIQPAFAGPSAGITSGTGLLNILLQPIALYASQQLVTVHVTSRTVDGEATLDESYSFRIEDLTTPQLVAAQATGLRTVRVEFNEAVKQLSAGASDDALNPANWIVLPLEYPAVTPVVLSVASVSSSIVDVTVAVELSFGKLHQVQATGVKDVHGNAIAPPNNAVSFMSVRPQSPLGRSFDLWSMLPRKNRREDETGDLRRFILCLQDVVDLLLWEIDRFAEILDPDFAEEQYLDAMLLDLGNPFKFELSEIDKRRLLRVLVPLYRQKGTARGVANAVRFFLGIEATCLPWNADIWELGVSELGDDTLLGPSGSWALYAFDVSTNLVLTDEIRTRLRILVNYMKPAHTHFVNIVEPIPPSLPDHWELGVSLLGTETDLH